ncbi:hypothetical protein IV102_13960 [bacterium]|nr:hypothetical protein [bacterium]
MKISQSPRLHHKGTLTSLKNKIEQGRVPKDLVLVRDLNPLPLNSQVAVQQGRSRYLSRLLPVTGGLAMGGAAVGMLVGGSLTPVLHTTNLMLPILAGTVVGAGVGALVGWDQGKDLSGRVSVEADGRSHLQSWRGDPQLRNRSSDELTLMLTALGELGETIAPASVELSGRPDEQALTDWKKHKDQLLQLAEDRRLVADLGGTSRYGHKALQMVDANAARELAARGRSVFVVNGDKTSDHPHHLRTTAYTGTRNEVVVDDYQYVERTFDYRLLPLKDLEQADPQASGLPEGLVGVYADGSSITQSVDRRCEQGQRFFLDKDKDITRHRVEKSTRVEKPLVDPSGVGQVLTNLTRNSTKASTIAGSVLGGCAAGLLGIDPTAGLIAGGVTGHLLGRVSLASQPGTVAPKVIRALMMAAGAAVGVGLAMHGGVEASLAVGAVGGLMTGVWGASRLSPQNVHGLAQGAFVGGTVLGIVAGISGAPWATLPLAALGAVGGAVVGRIAT